MAKNLTKKQELFVGEYLTDLNATRAAIAIGCPEKSAHVTASKWLRNAKVKAEIERKTEKRLNKLEISADKVLQEIAKLAFFDPRKFFNDDGSAKKIHALDDVTAAALGGLEIFEEYEGRGEERNLAGYTKKFKFVDKGQNLERLGKHLRLFVDVQQHQNADGSPLNIQVTFVDGAAKR